jgi:SlyX protein
MGIIFIMNNDIKNLEEITSFLQKELSQISDEVFNQQNEIANLKNEVTKLKKRIIELQEELETNIDKGNQIPPHY